MKDKLIKPEFNGLSVSEYLRSLGCQISLLTKEDTEDISNVRISDKFVTYSFKKITDCTKFTSFLEFHDISYALPRPSVGARYPFHTIIDCNRKEPTYDQNRVSEVQGEHLKLKPVYRGFDSKQIIDRTHYKPDEVLKALELVKELKNITVKSQDYYTAANLRDMERYFVDKIEKDTNRTI